MSKRLSRSVLLALPVVLLAASALPSPVVQAPQGSGLRFAISVPAERSGEPLDGRMLLMISSNPEGEPP